ncbi:hypothetical protein PAEVO_53380 [Paenibacillus sp. GM2FR]|uniref:hypothetical protein n=1 Tax=Paenibacillus sp. GM2FR TaxID=2059268 RepID=UPI000C2701C7|nr:hypothetical protein [Paenibacillus sp. GM2FR]PJN50294.1 hypothetical protein PAEVO_53380 [Paenibacillus sp. GM2FR]
MSKILVPPEVLLAVSDQFDRSSDQLEANKNTLNQRIQMLASCVEDKANALVEDPIGTGKQMAYDVTIGTAEEVLNTTIWGAKMAFDVGDTREKFGERIQAEQERMNEMGKSAYLGQQGAKAL